MKFTPFFCALTFLFLLLQIAKSDSSSRFLLISETLPDPNANGSLPSSPSSPPSISNVSSSNAPNSSSQNDSSNSSASNSSNTSNQTGNSSYVEDPGPCGNPLLRSPVFRKGIPGLNATQTAADSLRYCKALQSQPVCCSNRTINTLDRYLKVIRQNLTEVLKSKDLSLARTNTALQKTLKSLRKINFLQVEFMKLVNGSDSRGERARSLLNTPMVVANKTSTQIRWDRASRIAKMANESGKALSEYDFSDDSDQNRFNNMSTNDSAQQDSGDDVCNFDVLFLAQVSNFYEIDLLSFDFSQESEISRFQTQTKLDSIDDEDVYSIYSNDDPQENDDEWSPDSEPAVPAADNEPDGPDSESDGEGFFPDDETPDLRYTSTSDNSGYSSLGDDADEDSNAAAIGFDPQDYENDDDPEMNVPYTPEEDDPASDEDEGSGGSSGGSSSGGSSDEDDPEASDEGSGGSSDEDEGGSSSSDDEDEGGGSSSDDEDEGGSSSSDDEDEGGSSSSGSSDSGDDEGGDDDRRRVLVEAESNDPISSVRKILANITVPAPILVLMNMTDRPSLRLTEDGAFLDRLEAFIRDLDRQFLLYQKSRKACFDHVMRQYSKLACLGCSANRSSFNSDGKLLLSSNVCSELAAQCVDYVSLDERLSGFEGFVAYELVANYTGYLATMLDKLVGAFEETVNGNDGNATFAAVYAEFQSFAPLPLSLMREITYKMRKVPGECKKGSSCQYVCDYILGLHGIQKRTLLEPGSKLVYSDANKVLAIQDQGNDTSVLYWDDGFDITEIKSGMENRALFEEDPANVKKQFGWSFGQRLGFAVVLVIGILGFMA